jgi:hypothetical protein
VVHSVATTTTKAPGVIKSDIRRVLDRMQVQYRETKTGFECIHLPSIDISSLGSAPAHRGTRHRKQPSTGSTESRKQPGVVRKTSKLSFGVGKKDKDKERADGTGSVREKDLPGRPSVGSGGGGVATQSSGSSSFFNVSSNAHTIVPEQSNLADPEGTGEDGVPKGLPALPAELGYAAPPQGMPFPTGEVAREVFDTIGQNTLAVRFDINVVKVRFFFVGGRWFGMRVLTGV